MTPALKTQLQNRLLELGQMPDEDRAAAFQAMDEYDLICLAKANAIHVSRTRTQLIRAINAAAERVAAHQINPRPKRAQVRQQAAPLPLGTVLEVMVENLQHLSLSAAGFKLAPPRRDLAALLKDAGQKASAFTPSKLRA